MGTRLGDIAAKLRISLWTAADVPQIIPRGIFFLKNYFFDVLRMILQRFDAPNFRKLTVVIPK